MKYLTIILAMLVTQSAFAVNSGFLTGVVAITGPSTTYTVNRSTDTTIQNARNNDLLVLLPAAPSTGDTYMLKDTSGDCDQDGFLNHSFCVESVGQAVDIDGAGEECLVVCNEGAIYQYDGTHYFDIGDSF